MKPLVLLFMTMSLFNAASVYEVVDESNASEWQFDSELIRNLYQKYEIQNQVPVDTLVYKKKEGLLSLLYEAPVELPVQVKLIIENEKITHIGFHVFSMIERDVYDPIAQFLELYLLKLYARDLEEQDLYYILSTDKIAIDINGAALGGIVSSNTSLEVLLQIIEERQACELNTVNYEFQLMCKTANNDYIRISIPAEIELVRNKDRKELQDDFAETNKMPDKQHQLSLICEKAPAPSQMIPYDNRRMYRTKGTSLAPGLRSEYYYIKEKRSDLLRLVDNRNRSLEAVSNLLTCPRLGDAMIQMTYKMYGHETTTSQMNLYDFLRTFVDDHDVFVGFKQVDGGRVDATVVLKSQQYTYQHLLLLEDVEQLLLQSSASVLSGSFYAYIPNGNVEDLYGTFIESDGPKIKFKIK